MIGWVEPLHEAISCLTRLGKNHLASDLNRLLDTLDFYELEVFRNPLSEAIADQLLQVYELPDLVDLLRQLLRGNRRLALHAARGERASLHRLHHPRPHRLPGGVGGPLLQPPLSHHRPGAPRQRHGRVRLLLGHAAGEPTRPRAPSTTTPRPTASAPPATRCRSSPSAATRSRSRSLTPRTARHSATASATSSRTSSPSASASPRPSRAGLRTSPPSSPSPTTRWRSSAPWPWAPASRSSTRRPTSSAPM